MSVMRRADFKKELQDGLNSVFGLEYDKFAEQWSEVFDESSSDKAYEEDVLIAGLGGAQVKPEGTGVAYDAGGEVWTQRAVHETIALAFAITEEAIEDNLYGNLGSKFSKSLARSMVHTKEIKGVSILNNGFDTNFAIGDGAALFSAVHPLFYGGTGSNTLSTQSDLAESSLEDSFILISLMTDDRGIPIPINPQKLVIAPQNRFNAERLTQTQMRPGTADNDVNAHKKLGMLPGGYCMMQRLTDPNAWFIKTDCDDGMKYYRRKSLQRGIEGDFETGNMRYKARERYSFVAVNWRAMVGSSGSS